MFSTISESNFSFSALCCYLLCNKTVNRDAAVYSCEEVRSICLSYLIDSGLGLHATDWVAHKKFKYLGREFFDSNPYFQKIKLPEDKELNHIRLYTEPGSLDLGVVETQIANNKYGSVNTVAIYDRPDTMALADSDSEGSVWMSITPNEIFTMEKSITKAKGNVLVLGLGLGYYPYMVHLKDNVSKVTIVELNNNIIQLFKENILTQFDHPDKIEIVHADAFEFVKTNDMKVFDTIFIDIWKSAKDGVDMYLDFLAMGLTQTNVHYWIEETLVGSLRQQMQMHIKFADGYNNDNAILSADVFVALEHRADTAIHIGMCCKHRKYRTDIMQLGIENTPAIRKAIYRCVSKPMDDARIAAVEELSAAEVALLDELDCQ